MRPKNGWNRVKESKQWSSGLTPRHVKGKLKRNI